MEIFNWSVIVYMVFSFLLQKFIERDVRKNSRKIRKIQQDIMHNELFNAFQSHKKKKPCTQTTCSKPLLAKGLCSKHYQQMRKAKIA